MLKPECWSVVDELLQDALARAPEERSDFLAGACAGNPALRLEVESLIAHHEQAKEFLVASLPRIAEEVLVSHQALEGQTIGNYQVLGRLGAGGMGDIYLALDTRLGRKVALKLLPARFTSGRDHLRRFELEARATAAVNHPNIVTVHEVGEANGLRFIVGEFIDGRTLRQRMAVARMPLPEALHVAIQIAGALSAIHEAGMVHRDIKPENVMLTSDGHLKVLDFGLAKLTECSRPPDSGTLPLLDGKTAPGVVLGTAHYMPPEQIRGQSVDARSDIFSLGVLMFEMIAGRVPFEGETTVDVLAAILLTEPPSFQRLGVGASAELERIIRKALAKSREDRYQTVRDFLADLRLLEQRLGKQTRPEGDRGTEAAVVAGHRKVALLTLAAGVVLLVLAGNIFRPDWFQGRDQRVDRLDAGAAKGDTWLYWQSTQDVQLEFIGTRASRISTMLGDGPAHPRPDAMRLIKQSLDRYVARRDSLSADFGKESLRPIYARGSQYAPYILQAFRKHDVPPVIGLYLAMVETEFHPCVQNQIGLKGLFQILPQTARDYGLGATDLCDAAKEANAVGLYMADLIADFGSDSASATLAILSYSLGGSRVRSHLRELSRHGKKDRNFWALAANVELLDDHFRREGLRYVPKFFAAAIIGENPEAFGLQLKPLSSYTQ
jgi:hypothetical protein